MDTAKIFWSGRSQAVRLPKEFRFEGSEVRIRREGRKVVLEPIEDDWAWLDRLHALGPVDDEFVAAVLDRPKAEDFPDKDIFDGLMTFRGPIFSRFRYTSSRDCSISAITEHELYYGALRQSAPEKYLQRLATLRFEVLDFDREDARRASEIRARLASLGTPIGPLDALIAGQALARDLTLVTHNTREFERVAELRLEDWES
eukprot:gene3007-4108_t